MLVVLHQGCNIVCRPEIFFLWWSFADCPVEYQRTLRTWNGIMRTKYKKSRSKVWRIKTWDKISGKKFLLEEIVLLSVGAAEAWKGNWTNIVKCCYNGYHGLLAHSKNPKKNFPGQFFLKLKSFQNMSALFENFSFTFPPS